MAYILINAKKTVRKNIFAVIHTKSHIITQTLGFPAATDWVVANEELIPTNRHCIKNLTTGDLLHVRVVAVNPGGRSEPGALAEPVPIREVVGE